MNARRKFLLLAMATAPLFAIGAACTFPEVTFAPAGSGPDGGGSDSPNGSDGPATAEGGAVGANEDVDPTGAMMDATVLVDSGQIVNAPDGCCDCDNDHFKIDGGTCSFPSQDCDDLNPNIYPGQGFVASKWPASSHQPEGDWNCDGVRTKQYDYNQPCTDPNNCKDKVGFPDDPNCGEPGMLNVCSYNAGVIGLVGASCKVGSTIPATQACK